MTQHPVAPVPDRLFDDEREQRWRARFTAARMSRPAGPATRPTAASTRPTRAATTEVYAWDRATDTHRQVTDRRSGTHAAALPPDGETVWWFADTDGDEFGHWVAEPFAGRAAGSRAGAAAARRRGRLPGRPGDRPPASSPPAPRPTTAPRIWLRRGDGPAEVVYTHAEDAGVGALSEDETLLAISHSEHGDSRHPAVRVVRVADGSAGRREVRRPGQGPRPRSRSRPVARRRPAAAAARAPRPRGAAGLGRRRPDTETELAARPARRAGRRLLPGRRRRCWSGTPTRPAPGCTATTWTTGELAELPVAPGCVGSAEVRPDGTVEYTCSSAAEPARCARCTRTAPTACCSTPPGERGARARCRSRTSGSTGPAGGCTRWSRGRRTLDRSAARGVQPARRPARRRRGPVQRRCARPGWTPGSWSSRSTTAARPATARPGGTRSRAGPGCTELADVAAVLDHCVAAGLVDPGRCVVEGWSWGGYLALLALGTQPERWAAGHRRGAGGRLPRRLRRRDGAAARVRPGAVRRLPASARRPGRVAADLRRPGRARCSCWPGRTTRAARSARSTTTSTRWPPADALRGDPFDAGHGSLVARRRSQAGHRDRFARRVAGGSEPQPWLDVDVAAGGLGVRAHLVRARPARRPAPGPGRAGRR